MQESENGIGQPLGDRVVVRPAKAPDMQGSIIIPDQAKKRPVEGEVVAVGEGKFRDDGTRQTLDVSVGDRVLFGSYSGTEVKLEAEEFIILREEDILMKLPKRTS
jgi:chaperonin GroES